ncbi:unnamed protein product [Peniophora sp. CBMAI 1063]|nr:unnamed protein product [Peniophora sp. CBMAI 1063]
MAESRPSPLPARSAPGAPSNRNVGSLLQNRGGQRGGATPIPPSLQAKMAAMANRAQQPPSANPDATAAALGRMQLGDRGPASAPAVPRMPSGRPGMGGLKRNKPGFKLSDITGEDNSSAANAGLGAGAPSLNREWQPRKPVVTGTPFANFRKIVDPSGALNFNGKAVLHASGVDFSNGASFSINMDQLQLEDELGKGAYGTVQRVLHKPTKVAMAMKEIRLELEESKLNAILMELDVLHRAVHPSIVEFYGAFFIESCVYYCMEYMDAGSVDKLYGVGVPEDVLARIVGSMVRGLKFLKDELQIIHRDIKPTNVLINLKGQVKLCDFGVSGQLEKSLAKTNIGCQSYMAPERIKGESQNAISTYTVSSDVWSVGLATIEIALGAYPYPPETYSNVFAQLQAIVHGDPPILPDSYSATAQDWVARCLVKQPEGRASYAELLEHPFLEDEVSRDVDMVGWTGRAVAWKIEQREKDRQESLAKDAPPE